MQGVPLRLELGPRDMQEKKVMAARRDTGAKESLGWDELATRVPALLEQVQVCRQSSPGPTDIPYQHPSAIRSRIWLQLQRLCCLCFWGHRPREAGTVVLNTKLF